MKTYEVVYGQSADHDRTSMVTRSVLGILTDLGAQIAVPEAQVASGATKPSLGLIGGETRPTIIMRVGEKPPKDAYVAVQYDKAEYWIDRGNFDSKYAFTMVQNLMALAEVTDTAKAPVVTIPAGYVPTAVQANYPASIQAAEAHVSSERMAMMQATDYGSSTESGSQAGTATKRADPRGTFFGQ